MSKTQTRKIIHILTLTAILAVMLAVPCVASDVEGGSDTGLTKALESAMAWMAENPEAVVATVVTGIAGGVNLAGGVSNRKTRRSISRESADLRANSGRINNNAVELADQVKSAATGMVTAISATVGEAVRAMGATVGATVGEAVKTIGTEMGKVTNAIEQNTEEVRALKRETAANSYLLSEMIKDARMTTLRKDEILKGYEDIKGGDGVHEGDDQA